MESPSIEIELRYKVTDPQAVIANLGRLGITVTGRTRVIDQWFAPRTLQNLAQEEDWFDNQQGVAWRVRRNEQPDGTFIVAVESKQHTEAHDHNTFAEGRMEVANYDDALEKMAELEYRNWLTITKTRTVFSSGDPEVALTLDVVDGLAEKIGVGAVLELEYRGALSREEALQKLAVFATRLGFSAQDLFEKSLTVEAKPALATFEDSTP